MSKYDELEIDCLCTDVMTCPYCGKKHFDAGNELKHDYGKYECGICRNEFEYNREINITFNTNKL